MQGAPKHPNKHTPTQIAPDFSTLFKQMRVHVCVGSARRQVVISPIISHQQVLAPQHNACEREICFNSVERQWLRLRKGFVCGCDRDNIACSKIKAGSEKTKMDGGANGLQKRVHLTSFNWVSVEFNKPPSCETIKIHISYQCYGHFDEYYVTVVRQQNKRTNEETLMGIFRTLNKGATI